MVMKAIRITVIIWIIVCIIGGCAQPNVDNDATVLLEVDCIAQMPLFPTGCEAVSTVMALQYLGETISIEAFIVNHLPMSRDFYYQNGRLNGPDPHQRFVGDPRTQNSYGCFAPVIETALHHYFGSEERVINTTGTTIPDLCKEYIDRGLPVILWASIRMEPIKSGTVWFLPNSERFVWPSGEHCVLLIGYDDTHYYVNDPYEGRICAYERATVEKRYREMDCQSLVITNDKTSCQSAGGFVLEECHLTGFGKMVHHAEIA